MKIITEVGTQPPEILFVVKSNLLKYDNVLQTIQDMLQYVLDELSTLLTIWINSKIPKDTGLLRSDILKSLRENSEITAYILKMLLKTDLEYAERVAAMDTFQVRHIIDPEAIGNFWMELELYTKEMLMTILQRSIDEYFGGIGKLMRKVRGVE